MTHTKPYRHYGILAKMAEQELKDFSEEEINRVFANCGAPTVCKRGLKMMLEDGLTLQEFIEFSTIDISTTHGKE